MPNDANQNVWSTALVNSVSYPVGVVGRPGLDPGTLGLRVRDESSTESHRLQTTSSCRVTNPASPTKCNEIFLFQ